MFSVSFCIFSYFILLSLSYFNLNSIINNGLIVNFIWQTCGNGTIIQLPMSFTTAYIAGVVTESQDKSYGQGQANCRFHMGYSKTQAKVFIGQYSGITTSCIFIGY